ncbi:centrosomal protein of 57 kDa-like isoform X2 [Physella acuta]|uniref:centrosomal protein of 57 kDa-like isoform X2 n=1 Tax=Physella acuta TaxID=109671 RepID=UPI0027DB5E57|nr:centrosomal protein of 57 kDa-like isoform X2 [Physella acuta]
MEPAFLKADERKRYVAISCGSSACPKQLPRPQADHAMEESLLTSTDLSTRYMDYPPTKPFINTDLTRMDRPVDSFPTCGRDDVISALHKIRDKMRKLELERTASEQRLASDQMHGYTSDLVSDRRLAAQEHNGYPSDFHKYPVVTSDREAPTDSQPTDKTGQLFSAERRMRVLGQQLEDLQHLIRNSEQKRKDLDEKALRSHQERELGDIDVNIHMERLSELERDQARLTATQSLAERQIFDEALPESKIKELEERMREEKKHRKILEEKTAQLESVAAKSHMTSSGFQVPPHYSSVSQRLAGVVPSAHPHTAKQPSTTHPHTDKQPPATHFHRPKKSPKKKKKKVNQHPSLKVGHEHRSTTSQPMRHYRLNLAEIPFVAGKSTGPSHSLGANVQKVLSLMKSHNSALCSTHASADGQGSASTSSTGSSSPSSDHDLSDLLIQLQDELGLLNSEHHQILDQMDCARNLKVKEELEDQLEALVAKIEAKSQQILKVRQHQNKLDGIKVPRMTAPTKTAEKTKRPHSAKPRSAPTSRLHHNKATTQHHTLNRNGLVRPHSCNKPVGHAALGNPALYMLRDMKKLQSTLRRDDLSWD